MRHGAPPCLLKLTSDRVLIATLVDSSAQDTARALRHIGGVQVQWVGESLDSSDYMVTVTGINLPQGKDGKQPFALVVSTP